MAHALLEIKGLHVSIEGKEILKGVDLTLEKGQVHAFMGPNGSGKSTLSNVLMGHPNYQVTRGQILYNGTDLSKSTTDERARMGIFLAFQYPIAIPGVSVANFLREAMKAKFKDQVPVKEFRKRIKDQMNHLGMDDSFATRYVNEGFSGGEKKRLEILQMAVLKPQLGILDETDSGLDIDALKVVANGINSLRGPDAGFLLITHYQRILNYVQPDVVHVFIDGKVVRSGGKELALELEKSGYESFKTAPVT